VLTVSDRLAREQFLMTEDQIATLDDYELAMHIRRVQQIAHADRELNELLNERRRRQIVAVVGAEPDDDHLLGRRWPIDKSSAMPRCSPRSP
jgi:hypothetical protein